MFVLVKDPEVGRSFQRVLSFSFPVNAHLQDLCKILALIFVF